MEICSKLSVTLLCAASALALTSAANAQDTSTETVVVTGSRVISNAANSPTPLTSVSAADLVATTPTNIADGLNKLPVFQASQGPRSVTNATGGNNSNRGGNQLNLRFFGSQRTLVLLDGARVAPAGGDGVPDIDTLPQMLMTRVDVVTGGASAVYGSDAVTGVVNFVLDHHFSGVKFAVNAGISKYADAASYNAELAAGTDLLGGRAHWEMEARMFHQDGIFARDRPWSNFAIDHGQETGGLNLWGYAGSGTVAAPYYLIKTNLSTNYTYGGKIDNCGSCAANNQQFAQNGVIGPINYGIPTNSATQFNGGDGTSNGAGISSATATLSTEEYFNRFSYNLNDTTTAYVDLTAAESYNDSVAFNSYIQTGAVPNTFYVNNPYLTAAAQALLANPTGKFQLHEYTDVCLRCGFITDAVSRNLDLHAGIDGTLLDKYDWHVFYTHGEARTKLDDPQNQNNAKMYAAEDAVLSGGKIVCYATTAAAGAAANATYAGCLPMNPFGPSALTRGEYDYYHQDSNWISTNIMDDAGASISGEIFELPAGPVNAALSAEIRRNNIEVYSNAPPATVDCTGLRLCAATPYWQGNVSTSFPQTHTNVWEFAAETDLPLIKDVPLIQSLSVNLAGRYTDYSSSGAVQTWKIGLDYHVNDDVRFRATNSIDIRAPTLEDLYAPTQYTHTGFSDYHVDPNGYSTNVQLDTVSNANLVPEVARTYTAGVVLTPSFVPGLTASVDYFQINLTGAISTINGGNAVFQQQCEASGGTSPYCALVIRPGPFSDHSIPNAATESIAILLNAANQRTAGVDVETDYAFDMADVTDMLPGSVNLRVLGTIQPYNTTIPYVGSPQAFSASSKGRITAMATYTTGDWTFTLTDRWLSNWMKRIAYGQIYAVPRVPTRNYNDITIDKKFTFDGADLHGYLSIQNLFNVTPPTGATNAGDYTTNGNRNAYDVTGRYYTLGFRASL